MDKIQKFFKGLWRYKERIVLVALLCVLGYRVYELFTPKEIAAGEVDAVGSAAPPEVAPGSPATDAPGQYQTLVRRSPFSIYSDAMVDLNSVSPEELGLELLDIKEVIGKWRAQIRTKSAKKWYDEGEPFEQFVLESIDHEAGAVVVYVESIAKTVTLRFG